MKKLFFVTLFLAFTAGLFAQSTPEWQWLHPRPQAQYLNWMKMVDANTWYAAGDYGMFMKTTNAGVNWTTKTCGYPNPTYPGAGIYNNYKCGYFLNASTGFLGVQSVPGIMRTTNGGLTFDTIKILASGFGTVQGISFANTTTGYLAGTTTFGVMKTTNGGVNWTSCPIASGTYNCVYAVDANNAFVGGSSGNVYSTTDGGNTWNTLNVGVGTAIIYNMKFSNAQTGFVCGSSGLVKYTTNGGLNWTGSAPTTGSLWNIVVDGSSVYAAGFDQNQQAYKSTDNGNTWTTLSYYSAPTFTGFLCYGFDKNGNNMMCVGTYGEMVKSTNGGTNWVSLNYRRSLANLSGDLYAQSSGGTVIACGVNLDYPDAIMSSPDGGLSWNIPNFNISTYTNAISMINPSTGYLCGRYGLLYKTTTGGAMWDTTRAFNPMFINDFCQGISFINENTGWMSGGLPIVGGYTKIWKTTDGGFNWVQQIPAYSGPCGGTINMVNANTGYMTHGYGIEKTTNGGTNWITVSAPSPNASNTYRALKVIDAGTVAVGSSSCQVYMTVNGGITWDSLNFPVYAGGIFSTDWYNAQNGCISAVIGVVGRTTNRGQTWEVTNNGGYTVYAVKMVHPDTIFASCGNQFGSMVMKFAKGPVTNGFTYETSVPENYTLKQNYPNPFNPVTTIEFDLPKEGNVTLKIFDIAGREVAREINGLRLRTGNYKVHFDGSGLSSGVYFYSLIVDGASVSTKKMIMVK